jgi:broad specificity phosphatase PhoE
MSKPIALTLVRTGATSWERAGRLAGGVDVPLCPEAAAGCPGLADEAAKGSPTLILHAEDQASVATAKALAARTGARTRGVEDLSEINLGLWAGLTADALEERSPSIWRMWREDPTAVSVPEGEQVEAAAERVTSALVRALGKAKGETNVAVVLRPMSFGMVKCWLDSMPMTMLWQAIEGGSPVERREIVKDALRRDKAAS